MRNNKELEKVSTIMLNEQCSAAIIEGFATKLEDPGCLTFPCEFSNSTKTNALADLGASINLTL